MYKTIWKIQCSARKEQYTAEFTQYHFGANPKFPRWYFEEGKTYEVEMLWNVKIINTPKMLFKCLFNEYVIKG